MAVRLKVSAYIKYILEEGEIEMKEKEVAFPAQ